MITLSELQGYLNSLLYYDKKMNLLKIDPHMANGIHVKGAERIKKIGIGVSASLKLFQMAAEKHCQALVVHHSINFPQFNTYESLFQNRFAFLIKNNLSLFGYHFLLDSHPEIGHNIEILKYIGATPTKPFLFHDEPWGYIGEIKPTKLDDIIKKLKPELSSNLKLYDFGPKIIKKIAVCSGRGVPFSSELTYLTTNKVDLYITGENSEWIKEIFRESGINYLAGGHYHTERFGLLALEKKIKKDLNVETEFLELENEV